MLSSSKVTTLAVVLAVTASIALAAPPKKERKPDLPTVDISQEVDRHTVIAAGTEKIYQGHPNSVLMPGGKTMFAVWCVNHGGPCGPMARSDDAGKTWIRLDDQLPKEYKKHRNCPAIYRMVDAAGEERLWVISGNKGNKIHMPRLLSEDGGKTWKEYEPIGLYGGMPICSVVEGKKPGEYLAYYQNRIDAEGKELLGGPKPTSTFRIMQTVTVDGGQTWGAPTEVFHALNDPSPITGCKPCEPFTFRSPDGKELCCLLRENTHAGNSLVTFSGDEGKTWSEVAETPWGLTGDRHWGVYVKYGRLVITFRDMAVNSKTKGHFVGWVGTYDDIKKQQPGQYRVKLLHSNAGRDCGYPGVMVLGDDTVVALTYIKYKPGAKRHSVVATRFKLAELDKKVDKD